MKRLSSLLLRFGAVSLLFSLVINSPAAAPKAYELHCAVSSHINPQHMKFAAKRDGLYVFFSPGTPRKTAPWKGLPKAGSCNWVDRPLNRYEGNTLFIPYRNKHERDNLRNALLEGLYVGGRSQKYSANRGYYVLRSSAAVGSVPRRKDACYPATMVARTILSGNYDRYAFFSLMAHAHKIRNIPHLKVIKWGSGDRMPRC